MNNIYSLQNLLNRKLNKQKIHERMDLVSEVLPFSRHVQGIL